jgi:hypothetical protein
MSKCVVLVDLEYEKQCYIVGMLISTLLGVRRKPKEVKDDEVLSSADQNIAQQTDHVIQSVSIAVPLQRDIMTCDIEKTCRSHLTSKSFI